MKMNLRGLSLAAALIAASVPAWGDEGMSAVGDLPWFGDHPSNFVGDQAADAFVGDQGAAESPAYQLPSGHSPISHSDLFPMGASSHQVGNGHSFGGCSSACDLGCDSCSIGRIGKLLSRGGDGWLSAELLLWFPQQRRTPALVSTAPAGVQPVPGQPDVGIAFGGDIGGDLTPGFRIDGGRFLTENFGVGGRFWIIGDDRDRLSMSGNGAGDSIGRPFYNSDLPGPDSILVNLDGNFAGSVSVSSELQMLGAEAYGRYKFGGGSNHRVDLIGGYTHFSIDDRLRATSTTVNTGTGTASNFFDEFDAENRFHGGQIGLETTVSQGRWTLNSLAKVHLGNMNQAIGIRGNSSRVTTVPTVEDFATGALALDAQGAFERDKFAFAPELNIKLAYRFRPNVLLSVGYSFLYFDNVLLAGDHIDPVFDGSTILTAGPYGQRDFEFKDSSLWIQGIDLGFILDF